MALTTHPHLVARLRKEQSYTSTPPAGLHGVSCRVNFTFTMAVSMKITVFVDVILSSSA